MNAIRISVFAIFCFAAGGCYNDTKEELYGLSSQNVKCDTTGITYSKSIAGIINANCNACHSSGQAPRNGNGIVLDNYADLVIQADNGKLVGSIAHSPGYNAMPPNASKISACDITFIRHWIEIGKPNN